VKKFIFLSFIITSISYSQNPKSPENLPKNYHLIEINSVDFKHDNFTQKTVFKYNENGTIKSFEMSSKMFQINNLISYKDGFISEILFDNSNSDLSALTVFNYKNDRLSTIISKRTSVEKPKLYEQITTTKYFSYFENRIEITLESKDNRLPATKETIFLDTDGDFLRKTNNQYELPKFTYDNKRNPSDLVMPKYLMGYIEFGSGNKLTEGENITYEYIYNTFDLPIEQNEFEKGKLIKTTKYTYK
jgi:hypothetical protein